MSAREPFTSCWGREGTKDGLATLLMLCLWGPQPGGGPRQMLVLGLRICFLLPPLSRRLLVFTEEVCLHSTSLHAPAFAKRLGSGFVLTHRLMQCLEREGSLHMHVRSPRPPSSWWGGHSLQGLCLELDSSHKGTSVDR